MDQIDANGVLRQPPANTLYLGSRGNQGQPVVTAGGRVLSPIPSQKLHNHSPDGFEWGYQGSGPAQLALALLLHATQNNKITALDYYQAFKREVVSTFQKGGWVITRERILKWLAGKVCPLPGPDLGGEGGAE